MAEAAVGVKRPSYASWSGILYRPIKHRVDGLMSAGTYRHLPQALGFSMDVISCILPLLLLRRPQKQASQVPRRRHRRQKLPCSLSEKKVEGMRKRAPLAIVLVVP